MQDNPLISVVCNKRLIYSEQLSKGPSLSDSLFSVLYTHEVNELFVIVKGIIAETIPDGSVELEKLDDGRFIIYSEIDLKSLITLCRVLGLASIKIYSDFDFYRHTVLDKAVIVDEYYNGDLKITVMDNNLICSEIVKPQVSESVIRMFAQKYDTDRILNATMGCGDLDWGLLNFKELPENIRDALASSLFVFQRKETTIVQIPRHINNEMVEDEILSEDNSSKTDEIIHTSSDTPNWISEALEKKSLKDRIAERFKSEDELNPYDKSIYEENKSKFSLIKELDKVLVAFLSLLILVVGLSMYAQKSKSVSDLSEDEILQLRKRITYFDRKIKSQGMFYSNFYKTVVESGFTGDIKEIVADSGIVTMVLVVKSPEDIEKIKQALSNRYSLLQVEETGQQFISEESFTEVRIVFA